jgi:hypothetical protein
MSVLRRNITISQFFQGGGVPNAWTENIYLPFTPTHMIVRQITYMQDRTLEALLSLQCDLCTESLGCFIDPSCTALNIIIPLNTPVSGAVGFYVTENRSPTTTLIGILTAQLEFVYDPTL